MVTMDNFDSSSFDIYDINLIQKEVGGGVISFEQIDTIKDFPDSKSIIISGLKQDTFEYFVNTYGKQFQAITFWKNKGVSDLSALSLLSDIEYISYFFNQKASKLWDMTNNKKLIGLSLTDFSKLRSLDGIEKGSNLEYFDIGNRVEARMEIESFKPIVNTNIRHFSWSGNKVQDNDFGCLAHSKIEELDILMELNVNTPAYFNQHYGIDDEVYRFCQNAYRYFKDKEYSDTLHTIGITPVAAPQELYDNGVWKESVKLISNKSCAIISIRMDFREYYNADSIEKILLTKKMILKAVKKIKSKGKFDYDAFERDFDAISTI